MWLYGTDFAGYTATATTAASSYPIARLSDRGEHPYLREWRSTVVTQTDVTLDLGSDTSVAGLALFRVNATHVQVATATAAASPTYTGWGETTYAIARNKPGPYYNLCLAQPVHARYIRLRFLASTPRHVSGQGYYAIGLALVLAQLHAMQEPRVGMVETLDARYLTNEHVVARSAEEWSEEQWGVLWKTEQRDQGFDILTLGKDTDVVIYRNGNNRAEVKMVRQSGAVTVTHEGSHYTTAQTWKEHV